MAIEKDLVQAVGALSEQDQLAVLQFALFLGERADAVASFDAIASEPERRRRFVAAVEEGWSQSERGEGRPADDVFAALRAKSTRPTERG